VSAAERGFTLVELLVAAAVLMVITAALLQFAVMTARLVHVQGDVGEMSQRARVAAAIFHRDLVMAGAGPWHGPAAGSTGDRIPAVRPFRAGPKQPDPELTFADDRMSVLYVADTRVQTRLVADMAGPAAPLVIGADGPGCPGGGACGFRAGDRALVLGGGAGEGEVFTVQAAGSGLLTPADALSRPYPDGSAVSLVTERVYYLDRVRRRLMVYDGSQTDSVVLDHVADMRVTYFASGAGPEPAWEALDQASLVDGPVLGAAPHRFDADLLRIRRVRVAISFEAPAGWRGAGGWRPARSLTLDVTPRNLGSAR
jgi:prepilin-type N-terminal cleavage/methylation domain-containing protein